MSEYVTPATRNQWSLRIFMNFPQNFDRSSKFFAYCLKNSIKCQVEYWDGLHPVDFVRKINHYVLTNLKRTVFYSLFHEKSVYVLNFWGLTYKTNLNILQIIQTRAIKSVFKLEILFNTNEIHLKNQILAI